MVHRYWGRSYSYKLSNEFNPLVLRYTNTLLHSHQLISIKTQFTITLSHGLTNAAKSVCFFHFSVIYAKNGIFVSNLMSTVDRYVFLWLTVQLYWELNVLNSLTPSLYLYTQWPLNPVVIRDCNLLENLWTVIVNNLSQEWNPVSCLFSYFVTLCWPLPLIYMLLCVLEERGERVNFWSANKASG